MPRRNPPKTEYDFARGERAKFFRVDATLVRSQVQFAALREALIEGETSGASTSFDFDRFIAGKRKRKSRR